MESYQQTVKARQLYNSSSNQSWNRTCFQGQEVLTKIVKYHVDKPGAQKLILSPNLKQLMEDARSSNIYDLMDCPINRYDIEST